MATRCRWLWNPFVHANTGQRCGTEARAEGAASFVSEGPPALDSIRQGDASMKGLIEFGGEGGGVVVVEVDDHDPGFVRAGSDDLITRVQSTFAQALRMLHP